jgi:uncharacterized protein YbjT (DUF2867 family)
VPWTTLRATQFHDLLVTVVQSMAKLPVIPVPGGFRFQPVDARDVADRLAELAVGTPAGLVPDIAGPQVYDLTALIRSYLQARGKHRPIIQLRLPGEAARAFRTGANLAPSGLWAAVPGRTSLPPGRPPRATPAPIRPSRRNAWSR